MKFKTTNKAIKDRFRTIIAIPYCDAQNLLKCSDAFAYNSGVYGWNCDFHNMMNGVCISTGYRAIGERADYELVKKYDDMARLEWANNLLSYDEKLERVAMLLDQFVAEVTR